MHFEITLLRSGFKKEIVIEAKNKLELPPTANHKLVALFEYTGTGLKVKSNDKLRTWTSGDYFEEADGFRIAEEANDVYQSFIRPAYIFDSSEKAESIKVFWKLHNGKLYQAKVLPTQFLKDAEYPVRADTTTSYYAGAGDGVVGNLVAPSWDACHDATSGSHVRYTVVADSGYNQYGKLSSSDWRNGRNFYPVDTSGLPDTATISSADFNVYIQGASGYEFDFGIVQTTQPSNTALTAADYDLCGAVDNPTEGSDSRIVVPDGAVTAKKTLALNSTGIGWISKTGYTKLGIREKICLDDTGGSMTNYYRPAFYYSEDATNKPYLEVCVSGEPV